MLSRIFPAQIDNQYRGHILGLWLFVPTALMKLMFAGVHILLADGGAQSASTMPLDSYPEGAAQNIIGLMARLGLEQVVIALIFLIVLLRYRALVPLMFVLTVAYYIGAETIIWFKPLSLAGVSGAKTPTLILIAIAVIGLLFSVFGKPKRVSSMR